jgi:IS1 family transposase
MRPGRSWEKKDKHCDPSNPDDQALGSHWDHILIDADSRLIVTLVVGKRTTETAAQAFADFYRRTDGQLPALFTTDEYPAYFSVLVGVYGVHKEDLELTVEQQTEFNWEDMPALYFPEEIAYATVHKERENGRVVGVEQRIVLGTPEQVAEALEESATSTTINTSYVERWNGTQRHQNARKARKVYTFSKELPFHVAVTWLCVVSYNFCWKPRTLRVQVQEEPRRYHYRTPAMVAGLASEPWSLQDILRQPLFPRQFPPGGSAATEELEGG